MGAKRGAENVETNQKSPTKKLRMGATKPNTQPSVPSRLLTWLREDGGQPETAPETPTPP